MEKIIISHTVQLLALGFSLFWSPNPLLGHENNRETINDECKSNYATIGLPTPWGTGVPEHFVCRDHYVLSFNGETKNPNWVVEHLTKNMLKGPGDRKDNFKADPLLPKAIRTSKADYLRSGYDRGHQAPAADFKINQSAMDDSFYLSNMSPQVGVGFNRGTWAKLEGKIRDWTKSHENLIVITGPIFKDLEPTIGDNNIVVPDEFYKIAFDPDTLQAIAFILPNERQPADSYKNHRVSIQTIERKTGLNFFPNLSFRDQNTFETTISTLWQ